MPISTQGVKLKVGSSEYKVKDFPDLGGEPDVIDTTTLSDTMKTSIPGIMEADSMPFLLNYDKAEYTEITSSSRTEDTKYELSFSDGSIFEWSGQHTIYVSGGGVNDPIEMTIVVFPATQPTLKTTA